MLDFSTSGILIAALQGLWLTLSPAALGTFVAGVGILALAACGIVVLPVRYRLPAIVLGGALAILGVGWQLALAEGAKTAILANAKAAIAADRERADLAEAAARDIGAQAVRDAEEYERALSAKKESDHAADVHPDRDRIAVPRDLARGLRALQRAGAH
ncbi:hypothetical protein [Methylobacterium gregans]|uniref:Uncharacterized protein n=1 Tax=Methylobacterium gregans TaxID=374424 RepID=A0AA37MAN1_9HYPH|nr:hypothetical protein [Methylobacterium gregans]MDQ0521933.1 hypothetical protein [Methylobacterium gregans]GJD78033.1 hypothetical protein NBEOAGPD_1245 [Methylobacterium gregans]GLS52003.1 hypothetical protein GCM10007886_01850 [Methylobacterium gregans]